MSENNSSILEQHQFVIYCEIEGQSLLSESQELMVRAVELIGLDMQKNQLAKMAVYFERECLSHLCPGDIGNISFEFLENWITDYNRLLKNGHERDVLAI